MADGGAIALNLALHEKQTAAFLSPATEILYGGAAGGGKSMMMRVAAIVWCAAIPGLQVYLFRRHFADLNKNHIQGPTSFLALLAPWIKAKRVKYNQSEHQFTFWNGAQITLCHCQYETDLIKYQGAEIHLLLIDELTHFTSTIYNFLRGRVRVVGITLPPQYAGQFPKIIAGANPGGIGHNWVRAAWVARLKPLEIQRMPKEDGGMLRQYIPARLADNPTLTEQDPGYADRLSGLGSAALVKAMLDGDWNIVSGGALDDVWSPHLILPRFAIPASWSLDRSFDWGSSKPFSVLWWAEADGTEVHLPNGRKFAPPPRSLILLHEWYGASGPNEGLKMPAPQIARGIKTREADLVAGKWVAATPRPGPADNSISDVSQPGTPTIAKEMESEGIRWTESDKAPGTRKIGLELIRVRMAESAKERPEKPALYVMDHCINAIAHWPVLPRDKDKPDDVDTESEDHDYDSMRYRVLKARSSARVEQLRI